MTRVSSGSTSSRLDSFVSRARSSSWSLLAVSTRMAPPSSVKSSPLARTIVVRASRHGMSRRVRLIVPFTLLPATMFLPLNSEIARRTVWMSAPCTSIEKRPGPVCTSPRRLRAERSWAPAGEAAVMAERATHATRRPVTSASRIVRDFLIIGATFLPLELDGHRLGVPIRGLTDHQLVLGQADDAPVDHGIADAEHVSVSAAVLDQGELVASPNDAYELHARDVQQR